VTRRLRPLRRGLRQDSSECLLESKDRARYYPGGGELIVKLVEKGTGRLIGVQAMNVITRLRGGATHPKGLGLSHAAHAWDH